MKTHRDEVLAHLETRRQTPLIGDNHAHFDRRF